MHVDGEKDKTSGKADANGSHVEQEAQEVGGDESDKEQHEGKHQAAEQEDVEDFKMVNDNAAEEANEGQESDEMETF